MIVSKKFWNIAKRLSTAQLQMKSGDDLMISDADFFNLDIGKRGHDYFLGFYSKAGLNLVFEKYGIFKELAKIGFSNIDFKVDTVDPYRHRLTMYDLDQKPSQTITELVIKKTVIDINMPFETPLNGKQFEAIAIEWLCMQNPRVKFNNKRPQLPGQKHPGLGLASKVVELLIISAWRLNMAGLVNIPDHYHNAYLYSRIFYYINPIDQAKLMAMIRDTKKYRLATVAWAMVNNAVLDRETHDPVRWYVSKQVTPLNKDLKKLFESRAYKNEVEKRSRYYHFIIDEEKIKMIKIKGVGDENQG